MTGVPESFLVLVAGLLGLFGGSFVTVVVHRGPTIWGLVEPPKALPARYSLALPRSHCPACGETIRIPHLIPLVGYLLANGKCKHCGAVIPVRYPLIEGLGLLAGVAAALTAGNALAFAGSLLFLLALLALGAIDWETGYLPDRITLPLLVLGLGFGAGSVFVPFIDSALGAAIGYAAFAALAAGYKALRGHEGLGHGDAKLLGAMGAFTGPYALPGIILIGSLFALLVIGIGALRGKSVNAQTEIHFGPFLAVGGAVMFLVF